MEEEKGKVPVLEEAFLGALVIAVAWVAYERLVPVLAGLNKPWFLKHADTTDCACLFAEVVSALGIPAEVYIALQMTDFDLV